MSDLPPPEGGGPAGPAVPPVEEPRATVPFLVLQFFIFPLAIVAVCVAVFVVFGLIAAERRAPATTSPRSAAGSANRRWQAAFELAKVLQAGKGPGARRPAARGGSSSRSSGSPRATTRACGATSRWPWAAWATRRRCPICWPRLAPRRPKAALPIPTRASTRSGRSARSAMPAQCPSSSRSRASDDAGMRKAAVHALGAFAGEEARDALRRALADAAEDVRWNAALALARPATIRRGARAAGDAGPRAPRDGAGAHAGAARARRCCRRWPRRRRCPRPARLSAALERLRDGDPSLKVREAARRALEAARLAHRSGREAGAARGDRVIRSRRGSTALA